MVLIYAIVATVPDVVKIPACQAIMVIAGMCPLMIHVAPTNVVIGLIAKV
jgi:hypothetical protein